MHEAIAARLQPERQQLRQRGIVLHDDHFGDVGCREVGGGRWRSRSDVDPRRRALLREQRGRETTHKRAGFLPAVSGAAIARVLEPLLGGCLELCRDDACLGKSERTSRAAQPMGIAAQCFYRSRVIARGDEPFG